MRLIKIFICLAAMGLVWPLTAAADWQGPVEVVKGKWGNAATEFGFSDGQYRVGLPEDFTIIKDGKIVIADYVNNAWKIFGQEGAFVKSILLPGSSLFGFDKENVISTRWNAEIKSFTIGLFDLKNETWIWIDLKNKVDYGAAMRAYVSNDGSRFVVPTNVENTSGLEYLATNGDVLNKITDRPLLFGKKMKSGRINVSKYHQVIKFEDAIFNCTVPDGFDAFRRDNKGYLYGIAHNVGEPSHTRIYKITKCGKIIGTVDFPSRKETFLEDDVRVDEDYGEPVFAPNGDVYTWKRTPEHYSILKWTWQDDPSGPKGHDCEKEKGELAK